MKKETLQIKNRFTDKIIIETEGENLKDVVVKNKTNLRGANLQEADLRGANIQGADIREANIWGAKIKNNQKEELLKDLGIIIEE